MDFQPIAGLGLRNPVSALTHLLACIFAVYVCAVLWRLARGDRLRQWSIGIFGLAMIFLYGASATYHALIVEPELLDYFRRLDHTGIYLLIAGTFTPIFAILLSGSMRIVMLALMWTQALVGIALKWLLPMPPHGLTVGMYIAMGWTGLIPVVQLTRAVGWRGMVVSVTGGLLYTVGGVLDAIRWPVLWPGVVGHHEVFHIFDIGGTFSHIVFMIRYVLPFRR